MGTNAATVKIGLKSKTGAVRNIDEPYSHLAVSIILQAYDDLKALQGADKAYAESSVVSKWEIINFFRSNWCGILLSFQETVTQEQLQEAVLSVLENKEV